MDITTLQEIKGSTRVIEINGISRVQSVVFISDAKRIIGAEAGGMIRWWETTGGKEVGMPIDAGRCINNIAVSQDGKWLVSGATSGKAALWNAENRRMVVELTGHTNAVCAVDVSPDATKIVTGSWDETACLWSLPTGKKLFTLEHDGSVVAAKFSPDGKLLLTATWNSVWIYDLGNACFVIDFKITVSSYLNQSTAWHHNSKNFFVLSPDGCVSHLDVSAGTTLSKWHIHSDDDPRCLALSSDSTYIVVSANSTISFWDSLTHQQIGSPIKHTGTVMAMGISMSHDVVTSAGTTITIRSVRYYTSSASRDLYIKLVNLRSCHAIKLRELRDRKLALLTAQRDYWKNVVASKQNKLTAVQRELNKLPDVSLALISAHMDIRTSQSDLHGIYQQLGDQLRGLSITSAVAESQPELAKSQNFQRFIVDSDEYAQKAIIQTLECLNTDIQKSATLIAEYFIDHLQSPDTEERLSAMKRIPSESVPQTLLDRLGPKTPLDNRIITITYLQIAFQACIACYLHWVISSWTMDKGKDKIFNKIYKGSQESGSQELAAGWRSVTYTHVFTWTSDTNTLISDIVGELSDVVVAAGCGISAASVRPKLSSMFYARISSIVSTAEVLRNLIGGTAGGNFEVFAVRTAQVFDQEKMDIHSFTGKARMSRMPRGQKVECTTCLGLLQGVTSPVPGQANTLILSKAKVLL